MQRIVIDTNVIVSSLIQRGYPNLIINNLFIEQKFQLCISDELLAEYYEVLARPKFSKFQNFFIRAEALLVEIEAKATKYVPTITLDLIADDDDNMILELAHECLANFVIKLGLNFMRYNFAQFHSGTLNINMDQSCNG